MANANNMVSEQRNISDFYNKIQQSGGLRYGYQFLVKLFFDKAVFNTRGAYSDKDLILFKQYGINGYEKIIDANPATKDDLTFFAQATQLPGTTLDATQVQYFAQGFRFPGIIKYDAQWSIDILLDQDLTIYKQLRIWQEMMSSIVRNSGGNKVIPNARGKLYLLDSYGDATKPDRIYAMEGIFPKEVPVINMQYTEGSSTIKTVKVQFALQYFR
jgi:hypothetical protein